MKKQLSKKQRRKNRNRAPKRVPGRSNGTTTVRKSMPSAISQQITNRGALRQITLKHKEFVTDVEYQSNWQTTHLIQYDINPGLPLRFPWLAGIAKQFESYVFTDLSYIYVPAVGTTEKGSIAIVPDYDPADDNSGMTKAQLFSFQDSKRGPLWANLRMTCGKQNLRKQKNYYVRETSLASNLDIKTYDPLSLTLMLNHEPEQINLGELWVEYTIVLKTPQLQDDVNIDSNLESQWDPAVHDPYTNGIEAQGTYPVSDDGAAKLNMKKAGYYMYHNQMDVQTLDDTQPSVGFLQFASGITPKLLGASFVNNGFRLYQSDETGAIYLPNFIEDYINGIAATNPGFSNITASAVAYSNMILTPISEAMFNGLVFASDHTDLDLSKKYKPGLVWRGKLKNKNRERKLVREQSKLLKSVESLDKPKRLEFSTKNGTSVPVGPMQYVTTS